MTLSATLPPAVAQIEKLSRHLTPAEIERRKEAALAETDPVPPGEPQPSFDEGSAR